MPRDSTKFILEKASTEFKLDIGEKVFKIKGDPIRLHRVLYKFLRKRDKDVKLSKAEDGVWIRSRE